MGSKKESGKDQSERLAQIMRRRPSPALTIAIALFVAVLTATTASLAAGGSSSSTTAASPPATKSASVKKQIKGLSKRVAALESRAPVPGPQGAQGAQGPAGLSTGPAGGDLAGTYPDPSIAAGAVGTGKLADLAVTNAKLADHAVTGDKVAHNTLTGENIDQSTLNNVSPSGPAGGALSGTYPNPALNVTGGPCANNQAVRDISSLAALTCGPGVYSDGAGNAAAGQSAPFAISGAENAAFGFGSLAGNTTGNDNSALGAFALGSNSTGSRNSAVGWGALAINGIGIGNTAVGWESLQNNSTGNNNAALGSSALEGNNGSDNVAVGSSAGSGVGDTGSGNIAIGKGAGTSGAAGDAGSNNVAIGNGAGFHYPAGRGSNNIALGASAGGHSGTLGNNNIDIGNTGLPNDNNTIRIGANQFQPTPQQTRAFITGIRGVTTGNADAIPVMIDSAGQLGTVSSSRRFKEDIRRMASASDPIMKLKPVTFRYRSNPSGLEYGLIAEQVAKVMPNLAIYGKGGRPETVKYQDLPVLLLNKVQQQQRQIRALETRNHRLKDLQQQVDWLMSKVRGR